MCLDKADMLDLKQRVAKLEVEVEKLKLELEKLKVRVSSLERSVSLIEFEHGEKLSALFDNMKVNDDAHERIEKSILKLKSEIQVTLFNHEKRITNLEGNLVPNF